MQINTYALGIFYIAHKCVINTAGIHRWFDERKYTEKSYKDHLLRRQR